MSNFRFVVIGDSQGSHHGIDKKILEKILYRVTSLDPQPEFLLFTGDLTEGDGDGYDDLHYWRDNVTNFYPISMIFPAMGNHEPDEETFAEVFSHLPDNGPSGFNRTAYMFDYGNSRFFCLNSNRSHKISGNQSDWLIKHLQYALREGKEHFFVYFHHPSYPVGRHLGSSLDYHPYYRNTFWKIIDKYNVDLVFNGHEHNYSRRYINSAMNTEMDGKEFVFKNSIYQIICGGGGAKLNDEAYSTKNVKVGPVKSYHFVVVDIESHTVKIHVYDPDGDVLDSFSVSKSRKIDLSTKQRFVRRYLLRY
ncbi:metallophosphoesterase [Desulfofarcimen acetoxidans DSM 771]|jgi:hypothetical protein|uniref:Metallophosphoesterase n=1 Tax=Desulfofarcimen acetoxidans (strain ATCC 49208 / DSM 771 / KCTC 5769 / VKM B-1644 / 5575) TaxID=485916 RepID=C8W4F0_DESAS|nr:metallophosphoesterase [Desulfofarcimen acetoxidans]ACV62018.1 metallophosphoesterase [Desulfofarcimen acetoxidans DSM 771]